ncbi:hypothetical protein C8T65DRAFT_63274 [Cerioporus squamosus]|nr:hypothetical protein C8T65DRAFT_63274 [Cerioporus squamosus]
MRVRFAFRAPSYCPLVLTRRTPPPQLTMAGLPLPYHTHFARSLFMPAAPHLCSEASMAPERPQLELGQARWRRGQRRLGHRDYARTRKPFQNALPYHGAPSRSSSPPHARMLFWRLLRILTARSYQPENAREGTESRRYERGSACPQAVFEPAQYHRLPPIPSDMAIESNHLTDEHGHPRQSRTSRCFCGCVNPPSSSRFFLPAWYRHDDVRRLHCSSAR